MAKVNPQVLFYVQITLLLGRSEPVFYEWWTANLRHNDDVSYEPTIFTWSFLTKLFDFKCNLKLLKEIQVLLQNFLVNFRIS